MNTPETPGQELPFHPVIAGWFAARFGAPTPAQAAAWPHIQSGRPVLIAAPTGSGKTLAAFMAALDQLFRQGLAGTLADGVQVVYVSPLKALSNDIRKNLAEPLAGIRAALVAAGLPDVEVRAQVRTGDTPASERAAMSRRPPHILVTTPESLYILLTSEGGRRQLATARTLIVDEIHALVADKRGAHLALTMERLAHLTGGPLDRIGLSATQSPIEEVARYLVGAAAVAEDGTPDCAIIDTGHRRAMDLELVVPASPLDTVMSTEVWGELYDTLAALAAGHRTTLIFLNSRRLVERVTRHLSERLGPERVAAHHGSLSRPQRLAAEQELKAGRLTALVATASLELGIDIGSVDLVCQIGSPRSISAFLQRVGRSGHFLGGLPKGRLFPLNRDDLVECAALLMAVRRGVLDRLVIPTSPLDILAQQLVAAVAAGEWELDDLYGMVTRAWPFRTLTRVEFDRTVAMVVEGFSTRRGRRGALLHLDAIGGRLRPRRGARLTAITSGGAIPDNADYRVILEPEETFIGSVNEDFAVESAAGDVFQLGNAAWRILRVERGTVRVADAEGQAPNIPFWLGEAPGRTPELSDEVSALREGVALRVGEDGDPTRARAWLADHGLADAAADQILDYLLSARRALGVMPTQETLVLERFFDEAGDMHLVLHSPFGQRVNRAWGLALRKRFCRQFNFELQAAATDNAIVLSLGPTHSFVLDEVYRFLRSHTVRLVLIQALLDSPMFTVRARWNAGRALAVPRFRGGQKVAPQLQRMEVEDFLAVVFPDQLACAENLTGEREVPDHPLIHQTIRDCLEEAMDLDRLEGILAAIERGEKTLVARDLTEPSPLALGAVNAPPYAFLDDAPLEERRTQAIRGRRFHDPTTVGDLAALDAAAVERVTREAWPEARHADELHEALMLAGLVTAEEVAASGWEELGAQLVAAGRATRLAQGGRRFWVAAERLKDMEAALAGGGRGGALSEPALQLPPALAGAPPVEPEAARVELLRGRLEIGGPLTAAALSALFGFSAVEVEAALARLQQEGFALRGRYTPGTVEEEWCERRLLARIHRATLDRLRQEIEPVSLADFQRFLLAWQHAAPDARKSGPEGLSAVLETLSGFEARAVAWERDILPLRVAGYDAAWLDGLGQSGRWAWGRLRGDRPVPARVMPLSLVPRGEMPEWRALGRWRAAGASAPPLAEAPREPAYPLRTLLDYLAAYGASFFTEMATRVPLLRTQVEEALAELAARGLITADSFGGLRALLARHRPRGQRRLLRRPRLHRGPLASGVETAGRWSLLDGAVAGPGAVLEAPAPGRRTPEPLVALAARALLRRYGVIFRRLAERERLMPPWRELAAWCRREEARGELRGGRFVGGVTGEQFALPDAVAALRAARRAGTSGSWLVISATDPLNLVGVLQPGPRVPRLARNRLALKDGQAVAALVGGQLVEIGAIDPADRATAAERLHHRGGLLRPPA